MGFETSKEMKKHMEKIDEIASSLDKRCILLMMFFSVLYPKDPKKKYGFNELYRKLRKLTKDTGIRTSFSRQTLSEHLKHLLEKDLIEFEDDEKSRYRIKPRKYGLSKNYVKLIEDLRPLDFPQPEELLKRFRLKGTEESTIFLLMVYIELGFEMFKQTLTYPETYGPTIREYVFSRIENLTEAYRAIIFERNESEKALQVVEEFGEFVNKKLDEKYDLLKEDDSHGQN